MAALCAKLTVLVACCWSAMFLVAEGQQGTLVPSDEEMKAWARTVRQELVSDQRDKRIESLVNQGYNNVNVNQYRILDGKQIVQDMAQQLADGFAKKVEALRLLKEAAEKAVVSHCYDPDLPTVDFYDMNDTDGGRNGLHLVHHRRFGQPVNLSASGVHIPLGIDRGDARILNGLNWSQALDPVFRRNFDAEPELLTWQFFGSSDGFLRVYPANRWKPIPDTEDQYNVRHRPWYSQGSTSPKDMLILMDVSGSVHGQTVKTMKKAVEVLLKTLEEDDYVNVAWFSDKAEFVECFDTFVQANSRNKRKLLDGIQGLVAANMTSYAKALEFAFREFVNFSKTKRDYEGSECHRVIMIFTDGSTERTDEIIAKYNADKGVRIFSYALGPHTLPVSAVKAMACKNRGYFEIISPMGSASPMDIIRPKVQRYTNVLARPMALTNSGTESYSTVYADAGGLGLVVTVTLPVYNLSSESGNRMMVGVVGIDTPVRDIAATLPIHKTGPNSYPFAVNPNGFVVLHPRMRPRHNYLDDAPDIDFLDLEGGDLSPETYLELLRKDMIDEKTDSKPYLMYVEAGDPDHILQKNVTYHFTPIANTSFSLGVAVPSDRRLYIEPGAVRHGVQVGDLGFGDDEAVLVAPWNYCPGLTFTADDDPAEQVRRLRLELRQNASQCDQTLLLRLALDAEHTKPLHRMWNVNRTSATSGSDLDVNRTAVFLGTEGGLMRVIPKRAVSSFRWASDPYKATYYKKGLHYQDWAFFVSPDVTGYGPHRIVTAVHAITKTVVKDGEQYGHRLAVYGVQWNETGLHHLLRGLHVSGATCNDSDHLSCYLLDDGGYIMSSNHPAHAAQTGSFLGDVDAPLMWQLTEVSVYKRRLEYDYHAFCTRPDTWTSAAPLKALSIVSVLLRGLFHFFMDAFLWFVLSGWSSFPAAHSFGEVGDLDVLANYPCTKVRTLYYFTPLNEGASPVAGDIPCSNCSRPFVAVRIQQSNLLLVVVAASDSSCPLDLCGSIKLNHEPEVTDDGPNVCKMEPRYRRRPQTCFSNHSMEDTSECNATSRFTGDWLAMLATILTLMATLLRVSS